MTFYLYFIVQGGEMLQSVKPPEKDEIYLVEIGEMIIVRVEVKDGKQKIMELGTDGKTWEEVRPYIFNS